MYTLEVLTPGDEPVTVSDLKLHLYLQADDTTEDATLLSFIKMARETFEERTGRAVLTTTYRQHVQYINQPISLMKAPVQSISNVKYYDRSGTLVTSSDHMTDIITSPATVWWKTYPQTDSTKSPKGYVEFVAGWTPDTVPESVKVAIKILAGHLYANRESHTAIDYKELPFGFGSVVSQYRTGMIFNWRM